MSESKTFYKVCYTIGTANKVESGWTVRAAAEKFARVQKETRNARNVEIVPYTENRGVLPIDGWTQIEASPLNA